MKPCRDSVEWGGHGPALPNRARARGDDTGFVLPWFALMLIVLVAMAGFGVDVWNWWYTAQKEQRAVDAGALAGVPFMPLDLATATTTARNEVTKNGFNGSTATVAVGDRPNQLKVSLSTTVTNSFTSLLGLRTTSVARTATSEYNAPLAMGSPKPYLGNDPQNGSVAKHWLNIGAPNINVQTGDRYADYHNCSGAFFCSGSDNTEYLEAKTRQSTYFITIDVQGAAIGRNIDIQAYDPEYANGGGGTASCTVNWPSAADIATLAATYTDAATRFASGPTVGGGPNNYCPGDDDTNLGTPQATAYIVRGPDSTPVNNVDNPLVLSGGPGGGACTHQFKGYNSAFFPLLDPTNASYDADFANSFHRWYTLCNITNAQQGQYVVQIRSNLPYGTTLGQDGGRAYNDSTDAGIGGQNRYSFRAIDHGTDGTFAAPTAGTQTSGVSVYSQTHLPMYSNAGASGSTPNFYLAKVLPGGGTTGRTLFLDFYDIGDVSCDSTNTPGCGVTSIIITPPTDAGGTAASCVWSYDAQATMPYGNQGGTNNCTVTNMTNGNFNGHLVHTSIKIPGDYVCGTGSPRVIGPDDCWFKIQMVYTTGTIANDTTTWDANIGGDPVRLIK